MLPSEALGDPRWLQTAEWLVPSDSVHCVCWLYRGHWGLLLCHLKRQVWNTPECRAWLFQNKHRSHPVRACMRTSPTRKLPSCYVKDYLDWHPGEWCDISVTLIMNRLSPIFWELILTEFLTCDNSFFPFDLMQHQVVWHYMIYDFMYAFLPNWLRTVCEKQSFFYCPQWHLEL